MSVFFGVHGDLKSALTKSTKINSRYKERLYKKLSSAGFVSAGDVISHAPLSYEHRDVITPLADSVCGKKVLVHARVRAHNFVQLKNTHRRLLKITIQDAEQDMGAAAELHCYGREFLQNMLPTGTKVFIWGKFSKQYGISASGDFEVIKHNERKNAVIPRYALSGSGISQVMFALCVQAALDAAHIPDVLGTCARELDFLCILDAVCCDETGGTNVDIKNPLRITTEQACRMLHFPKSDEEICAARGYFAFLELLFFQLSVLRLRSHEQNAAAQNFKENTARLAGSRSASEEAAAFRDETLIMQKFTDNLPFALTRGQIAAVHEITQDMKKNIPMRRMLQGDVGAGKTVVALCCAVFAASRAGQTCFIVPSEALAMQHFVTIQKLCASVGLRAELLTGSTTAAHRKKIRKQLAEGDIDCLAGTHAVYGQDIQYKNLQLAVIDEQHRFGVAQRGAILAKGSFVHALLMSATPIPRSLALTLYSGMDISTLREGPARAGVKTKLILHKNSHKLYPHIAEKLSRGGQAFFVFPFIDEASDDESEEKNLGGCTSAPEISRKSKNNSMKKNTQPDADENISAAGMYDYIRRELAPYTTALLHSKIPARQRENILRQFACGEIAALVSTTIIEIGIDVASAAVMCVFDAQRFGLATLHQLRGRVGRAETPGEAFLVYRTPLSLVAKERLKTIYEQTDGFAIAERDLLLRGPGDINQLGMRQSGAVLFSFFDMAQHARMIEPARSLAQHILREDPHLCGEKNALLREQMAGSSMSAV